MNFITDLFAKKFYPFEIDVENISMIDDGKMVFLGQIKTGIVTVVQKAIIKSDSGDQEMNKILAEENNLEVVIKKIESFDNGNVKLARDGENVGLTLAGDLAGLNFKDIKKIINSKL